MSKIHRDEYMAIVPECCRLRTWEDHCDIMLCWGVANHIGKEGPMSSCGICEFNAEPAGDFARIVWETERAKARVWDTLKG